MNLHARLVLLLVLLLGAIAPQAEARGELEAIRRAIANAEKVRDRLIQVTKLVLHGSEGASTLLKWLVEHDPALHVRVAAARGLGEIKKPHATAALIDRVQHGGPWALRRAMHASLARHTDAPERLLRVIDDERRPLPARVLALRALGVFKDESSRERIIHYTASGNHALRDAALRALVRRRDDVEGRAAFLASRLAETTRAEYLRELLDVLEPALHPSMRPTLERLRDSETRDIASVARSLFERLPDPIAAPPPAPPKNDDPDERYAKQDPPTRPTDPVPPTPPSDPSRQDLVVVFDATGSARHLVRYVHEYVSAKIARRGSGSRSQRVGVIVYRGGHGRSARQRCVEMLALTYDLDRALTFIRDVDARGTDDRGAAMTIGLCEALERMSWRWNATRRVHVYADSGCDNPRASLARVKMHYDADRTQTAVTYHLRTRSKIPEELNKLAEAGGTTQARRLR